MARTVKQDLIYEKMIRDEGIHMKIPQRLMAILAAAFILSGSFPAFAAAPGQIPEDVSLPDPATDTEETMEFPIPGEAPAFHAHIEFRMGYTVIGTFTDFTPDITLIETLHSLDGENWQTGTENWNLSVLGTDNEYLLTGLQNQPCLLSAHEPLKSYIAGEIDRFYLKLRITKKNGLSYESQSAVIERGGLQTIPEGTDCRARFSSEIAVRESTSDLPFRYRQYGRYQITIPQDATAEEISALLPDTLPVEVQLDHGADFMAIGIVDCPVTWKPLSLPTLTSGESITLSDAAEEIMIPAGTPISTPLGIFSLKEPLSLNTPPSTDEVRLVLNVSPEENCPSGVLKEDRDGLKIALRQKASGATDIRAYVLAEGESEWTELKGLSLLNELNTQPSTESSGYGLVLRKDQEPYQSYLKALASGETPTPFYIGLKIEGGIYDGRELILSWPDIYDQLPDLPKITGAEGNEGNAGSDNKDDSTESGQRPNLPQTPDNEQNHEQEEQQTAAVPDDSGQKQPADPVPSSEASSVIYENRVTHSASAGRPVSEPDRFIAGQQPSPFQRTPDAAEGPDFIFPSGKAVIVYTPKNGSHGLLLTAITAVIAAGGCIGGAAVCHAKGYSLFRRIAGKLRTILCK